MNATQLKGHERLEALGQFLMKELENDQFVFSDYVQQWEAKPGDENPMKTHFCTTVGCAGGWLPTLYPEQWEIRRLPSRIMIPFRVGFESPEETEVSSCLIQELAVFFEIKKKEAICLFLGNAVMNGVDERLPHRTGMYTATRVQVAENILALARIYREADKNPEGPTARDVLPPDSPQVLGE